MSAFCPNCGLDLVLDRETEFGSLTLKVGAVRWKDRPIHLTRSEYEVVESLVRARGDCIRGEILGERLGYDGLGNVVQVFIVRLRKKFKAVDPDFDALKTIWSQGYRWVEA